MCGAHTVTARAAPKKDRREAVIFSLLNLFLAAYTSAASPQWVAKNGRVTGCMVEKVLLPTSPCMVTGFADMQCAGVSEGKLLTSLAPCRKAQPPMAGWLRVGETQACAEMVKVPDQNAPAFLRFVKDQDCTHRWWKFGEDCGLQGSGNYTFHPLSAFGLGDLVPEVMNLADKEVMPPELLEKHGAKKLALTLNYRIYLDQEKERSEKTVKSHFDYLNETEIQLSFPEKYLDAILASGFLNQHQTAQSGGNLDPVWRAAAEDGQAGFKLENKYTRNTPDHPLHRLRPKYGYFSFLGMPKEEHPNAVSRNGIAKAYGNIFAVLNHDVKDRTTWTMDDSLNRVYEKKDVQTPRYRATELPPGESESLYIEAQIWGEVGTEDVNHYLVNCEGWPEISPEGLAKLKATGKPVRKCERDVAKPFEGPYYPAYDEKYLKSWGAEKFVDEKGRERVRYRPGTVRIRAGNEL